MPQTAQPIVRTSITEPLTARYAAATDLADVGGGSATNAGTQATAVEALDDQGIQSDFAVRQPIQTTEFTNKALTYATALGVNTTPYAPSGRE